ncbi:MAG: hypothetical protein K2N76_02390, partial [Muribaculaceae bacterium]|nr:hypothetical protein [Muribaculaceae bacterium]
MILSTALIIILVPLITAVAVGAPWLSALKERVRRMRAARSGNDAAAGQAAAAATVRETFGEVMERLQIRPSGLATTPGEDSGCTFD